MDGVDDETAGIIEVLDRTNVDSVSQCVSIEMSGKESKRPVLSSSRRQRCGTLQGGDLCSK